MQAQYYIDRHGTDTANSCTSAAERAWYLNRRDDFMVPKPVSRIVPAIGQPGPIPADAPLDGLEAHCLVVQEAVMSLVRESVEVLEEVRA